MRRAVRWARRSLMQRTLRRLLHRRRRRSVQPSMLERSRRPHPGRRSNIQPVPNPLALRRRSRLRIRRARLPVNTNLPSNPQATTNTSLSSMRRPRTRAVSTAANTSRASRPVRLGGSTTQRESTLQKAGRAGNTLACGVRSGTRASGSWCGVRPSGLAARRSSVLAPQPRQLRSWRSLPRNNIRPSATSLPPIQP